MSSHRSISQRLQRAKSPELKQEIAQEWAISWYQEQMALIAKLEHAIQNNNIDQLCVATGQLKAVTSKRFDALPNVLNSLKIT